MLAHCRAWAWHIILFSRYLFFPQRINALEKKSAASLTEVLCSHSVPSLHAFLNYSQKSHNLYLRCVLTAAWSRFWSLTSLDFDSWFVSIRVSTWCVSCNSANNKSKVIFIFLNNIVLKKSQYTKSISNGYTVQTLFTCGNSIAPPPCATYQIQNTKWVSLFKGLMLIAQITVPCLSPVDSFESSLPPSDTAPTSALSRENVSQLW